MVTPYDPVGGGGQGVSPSEPYHPSFVDQYGWDHRKFYLCWQNKSTGLVGQDLRPGGLAPGEAELWLARFHREDPYTLYWFEAKEADVSSDHPSGRQVLPHVEQAA